MNKTSAIPEDLGIFDLHALAEETPDVISLGLGDPDLPTPEHIVEAASQAMRERRWGMAPARGLPELRQAVAEKLARDNQVEVDPEREVLVTGGTQEALFLLIQSLLNPGDEILVPDPRYTSYDAAIEIAGGKMVMAETRPEDDFVLQPEAVEASITPKTKALLIISPSNPTAAVIPPDKMRQIAEIAVRHNLIVISDEIYERFIYGRNEHVSLASLPGMRERTVTLNGLSKTYAMTGWRVGYMAADAALIDAVAAHKERLNRATCTISQWAGVAALTGPQECVAEMRATYDRRRRVLGDALEEMGLRVASAAGALYVWVDVSSTGLKAMDLSYLWLKEGGVMAFPGTGFGDKWSDYMRITMLQPEVVLHQAVERMDQVLRNYGSVATG